MWRGLHCRRLWGQHVHMRAGAADASPCRFCSPYLARPSRGGFLFIPYKRVHVSLVCSTDSVARLSGAYAAYAGCASGANGNPHGSHLLMSAWHFFTPRSVRGALLETNVVLYAWQLPIRRHCKARTTPSTLAVVKQMKGHAGRSTVCGRACGGVGVLVSLLLQAVQSWLTCPCVNLPYTMTCKGCAVDVVQAGLQLAG